jgi:hypothetical protein
LADESTARRAAVTRRVVAGAVCARVRPRVGGAAPVRRSVAVPASSEPFVGVARVRRAGRDVGWVSADSSRIIGVVILSLVWYGVPPSAPGSRNERIPGLEPADVGRMGVCRDTNGWNSGWRSGAVACPPHIIDQLSRRYVVDCPDGRGFAVETGDLRGGSRRHVRVHMLEWGRTGADTGPE